MLAILRPVTIHALSDHVVLAAMPHEPAAPQLLVVELKRATIFLSSVWGQDATLNFVAH